MTLIGEIEEYRVALKLIAATAEYWKQENNPIMQSSMKYHNPPEHIATPIRLNDVLDRLKDICANALEDD